MYPLEYLNFIEFCFLPGLLPLPGLISIHETEENSETETKFKFLSCSGSTVFLFFDSIKQFNNQIRRCGVISCDSNSYGKL